MNTTTIADELKPEIEFEARVLTDNKVGLRIPVPPEPTNELDSPSVVWVCELLASLKTADPPSQIVLRKLGAPGPTGGLQVTPVEEPARGDMILEGLEVLHEGRPGDDHWYVTLKVKRAHIFKGGAADDEPLPKDTGDLLQALQALHDKILTLPVRQKGEGKPGFVVPEETMRELWAMAELIEPMLHGVADLSPEPPSVKSLLQAIKDGRIVTVAKSTIKGVALTFVDVEDGEKVETEAPIDAAPRKVYPVPRIVNKEGVTAEVSEQSLRDILTKILIEEHEAVTSASLRERVFARVLEVVDPVSPSKAIAHTKAVWFVSQAMRAFERKRMDRDDIKQLVADIATGKGIRG